MPPYSVLLSHGRLVHAGMGYDDARSRLHCYIGGPKMLSETRPRPKRIWSHSNIEQLQAKIEKHEQAEQRLIEEFEIKSYEYGIYTGEILHLVKQTKQMKQAHNPY